MSAASPSAAASKSAASKSSGKSNAPPKIRTKQVSVFYGAAQALFDVSLEIAPHRVTALIGPSGCGKTSFLRCLNRMNDVIEHCRVDGEIWVDEEEISAPHMDVVALRARIGMVFQKPNPFPKSVFDNVAYAPRLQGSAPNRAALAEEVQQALTKAGLWEEVKDRLHESALSLSGGQQQRLCIARAIAANPEIILMDEPCSALDPIATAKIEDLMDDLRRRYTIIVVTHSMQQAARISQKTAFFHLGRLIEYEETQKLFTTPQNPQTQNYITGKIG